MKTHEATKQIQVLSRAPSWKLQNLPNSLIKPCICRGFAGSTLCSFSASFGQLLSLKKAPEGTKGIKREKRKLLADSQARPRPHNSTYGDRVRGVKKETPSFKILVLIGDQTGLERLVQASTTTIMPLAQAMLNRPRQPN